MKICVVQMDWALQSYTRDLLNGLVGVGNDVFFIVNRRSLQGFVNLDTISCPVKIVEDASPLRSKFNKFRAKVAALSGFKTRIVSKFSYEKACQAFSVFCGADLVIGIEKAGLEVASFFSRTFHVPYVYYSLELYIEDHYARRRFEWQLWSERRCHRGAVATIVQDKFRWSVLSASNGVMDQKVFFLPIGVDDSTRVRFGDEHIPCPDSENKLLYFGIISRDRFSLDLFNVSSGLPDGVVVHLHGPLSDLGLSKLFLKENNNKFFFTTNMLPESQIFNLVRSAKIGLAFYRTDNSNDLLTAYSSQKIAVYFQCGLPIIAFRSDAYEDLFSRFKCGVMIDSIDQLPLAVQEILSDYRSYSSGALAAFREVYNLRNYWSSMSEFFIELSYGSVRGGCV